MYLPIAAILAYDTAKDHATAYDGCGMMQCKGIQAFEISGLMNGLRSVI
jgi:hypothetical protein